MTEQRRSELEQITKIAIAAGEHALSLFSRLGASDPEANLQTELEKAH